MADSSTGGYLTPTTLPDAPLFDIDLDKLFQRVAVGITGLPKPLVRPRWQPDLPKMPERDTDWCAIGVTDIRADDNPAFIHHAEGLGTDEYQRHEDITVMASFYGPHAAGYASRLRDGIYVNQNRDELYQNNIGLVYAGDIITAPELVNQLWVRRYDITLSFRRKISRVYEIRNLVSLEASVVTDTTGNDDETPITVEE